MVNLDAVKALPPSLSFPLPVLTNSHCSYAGSEQAPAPRLMQMRGMLDTTNFIADSFQEEYLLHFRKKYQYIFTLLSLKTCTNPRPSLLLIMLENFQTTFNKTLINSPGQITK